MATTTKMSTAQVDALIDRAHAAGMSAGTHSTPDPMGVRDSRTGQTWVVEGGPCGFAWVNVRPGTSQVAKRLRERKIGDKAYEGGVSVWVMHFHQSMARKEAYAYAFAKVLNDAGITASVGSRMD